MAYPLYWCSKLVDFTVLLSTVVPVGICFYLLAVLESSCCCFYFFVWVLYCSIVIVNYSFTGISGCLEFELEVSQQTLHCRADVGKMQLPTFVNLGPTAAANVGAMRFCTKVQRSANIGILQRADIGTCVSQQWWNNVSNVGPELANCS